MMEFSSEQSNFVFHVRDSEFENSILRKIGVERVVQMLLQDEVVVRFTRNGKFHPVLPDFITQRGSIASVTERVTSITLESNFGTSQEINNPETEPVVIIN